MGEKQFGARWWRESLGIARWASRPAAGTLGLLGALSLGGCATWGENAQEAEYASENVHVNVDALQLQREEGWDVGHAGATLGFTGSTQEDSSGGQTWRDGMVELAATMAPTSPSLQPFYVPTLFQSLIGPAGQRLRAVMRPMHTPEMDADFARGVALRAQFDAVGWPKDTALIVDAPGPRALAVATALADHFAPVFTFGNWPHPLGVVPAHQTIAAALWYRPMLAAGDQLRPADAPPVFVLDANRLNAYVDADKQFDNRYFVRLPSAEQLAAVGIKHVLYIGADGGRELDNLNGALLALCARGVDVKMVALSDFVRPGDAPQLAQGDDGNDDGDGDEDEAMTAVGVDPWWGAAFFWAHPWRVYPRYYYRACWWDPGLFWGDYAWYLPRNPHLGMPQHPMRPARGPVVIGPPKVARAAPLPTHAGWRPAARATIFSPSPTMASRPTFGQVPVHIGAASNVPTWHGTNLSGGGGRAAAAFMPSHASFGGASAAASPSFGRSGSIGRAGFGGFGGG
jgi:hypothetical protein